MTTAARSTALATIQPALTDAERFALAGFLAGYRGLTRDAHALDLRQLASWCQIRSVALLAVRRADIEGFARDLEARGRARATVTRRLKHHRRVLQVRGARRAGPADRSPAAYVRLPRIDYESHAVAMGRQRARRASGGGRARPAAGHALISLLVTAPERLFGSRPGKQALASLTSLCLACVASIAAALRFHAAAQIAHCERS